MVKTLFLATFSLFLACLTPVQGLAGPDPTAKALEAIIMAESSGDPLAVGDGGKARGLCQIQRSTWERLSGYPWSDAFDEEKNVQVAMKRIEEIRQRWNTDSPAYIAYRYNCGDHTKLSFEKWKKVNKNKVYRSLYK